ncbi:MAG TPA: hypothetical protein VN752_09125 [Solirubrobacterales bacterium]|nr:hypothetical protein [Solirubrobacterales bacterium]
MSPRIFFIGVLTLLSVGATGVAPAATDVPDPVATSAGAGCPSGDNPYDLDLWIHVKKWCIVPGVRGQAQFKVQMEIHNKSQQHSLDITQDQIRVIVHEFDPDRWSPSAIGAPTYDRPVHTTYRGEDVWAVPASADGAYDVFPDHSNRPTHATHWGFSELGPGRTLHPSYHNGDLVFNLPMPKRRAGVKANIVGVAYIKGLDIIALCPPDSWEKHRPAGTF